MPAEASKLYVLIAAAGHGTRMRSAIPKQFVSLAGVPVIVHTIRSFHQVWPDAQFIVVLPDEELPRWERLRRKYLAPLKPWVTKGGATRFHSVKNGLKLIKEDGLVAIHDACRPLLSAALLNRCRALAQQKGNAVPAIDITDSIRKITTSGSVHRDRSKYRMIQTPQCFRVALIKNAYRQPFQKNFTDDASVAEAAGTKIQLVEGEPLNLKVTTPADLLLVESLLQYVTFRS